jgi:hypothetical protein
MRIREILQWWGTEVRRAENPLYWVNELVRWVTDHQHQVHGVIIDDVRLENEVKCITQMGGVLLRIETYPGWSCVPSIAYHSTETALDDFKGWDLIIFPEYGGLSQYVRMLKFMWTG